MSIHDKMANRAVLMGKSSKDFHVAAHKHANSTWIFGLLAGSLWYFAGFYWAIIPSLLAVFTGAQSISLNNN